MARGVGAHEHGSGILMTKKNALGAAVTAAEGEILERTNHMSKLARRTRAAGARPGTIAADRRVAIIDEPESRDSIHYSDDAPIASYVSPVAAFTEEELETMPLVVVDSTTSRVQVWRGPDGTWYRRGSWLRIQPRPDGEGSQFKILLCKGANLDDLEGMLQVVKRTRAGHREQRWEKRGTDWATWADDRTFTFAFHSRPYADPYTHVDRSPDVVACTEPLCSARWHESWDVHQLDRTEVEMAGAAYEVRVTRSIDAVESPWAVEVHITDFIGTPGQVAALVSDLQWMQEACKRANEPVAADPVPTVADSRTGPENAAPIDWASSPAAGAVA